MNVKKLQGNSFSKSERLCSKRLIEKLFGKASKQFFIFPLKCSVLFTELPENVPAQLLLIVGRRNFKNAVQRNYLRRLLREAYRSNKHDLYRSLKEKNLSIAISIAYVNKDFISFSELGKKMKDLLTQLSDYVRNQSDTAAAQEEKAESLSK